MRERPGLTRRGLTLASLILAVFGGGGAGLPALSDEETARRVLGVLSPDFRGARRVGDQCLRCEGLVEPSLQGLLVDLFEGATGFARVPSSGREIKAVLASAVRRDFAEGRAVTVDGWVMSRTEARLFALSALLDENRRGI